MKELFTKLRSFLFSPNYRRSVTLIVVLIIAAIIPLTVITSQKTQEIRQRASVPDNRIGNSCSSIADCAPNTSCQDGICKLNSGESTDSGSFRCCGIDSQCSNGQACTGYEGFCQSGRKCGSANLKNYGEGCNANNVCNTNLSCTNGVCKFNSGVGDGAGNQCCGADSQCDGNQYCGGSGTGSRCQSNRSCVDRVGVNQSCASQSACQDNLTCTNGTCKWNNGQQNCCSSNSNCGNDQVCTGSESSCSSGKKCAAAPVPPTNTPVPPTATPVPPTNTPPVPPIETPVAATNTPVPPTSCIIAKNQGNANNDCDVNMADFNIWRAEYIAGSGTQADFDGNSTTNLVDFNIWRNRAYNLQ